MMTRPKSHTPGIILFLAFVACAPAGAVTWDGEAVDGLWSTTTNWNPNALPIAGDTVDITNGDVVDWNSAASGQSLPANLAINLTGGSTLTEAVVIRLNGATIDVEAGSTLTGSFWDLANGTLTFEDGAFASMSNWEQKGTNEFTFELGPSGFTTLTPGTFRRGGGTTMADATYNVDMASYAGPPATIALMDFNGDATGMDDATFQGAGALNVLNVGSYTASLHWNDGKDAIELRMEGTMDWDGDASDGLWTSPTNWASDALPTAGDYLSIGGGVTISTENVSGTNILPGALTLNLTDSSTLTTGNAGVLRLNGAIIHVGAGSTLAGAFWDLSNAHLIFDDGAMATMANWEQKGANTFTFNLGATGFTALTPGTFRNDGNNPATPAELISDDTYIVDMADYTGGTGVITLVDFSGDGEGMDNIAFQSAILSVLNIPDGLSATIQWNDAEENIELNIMSAGDLPRIIAIALDGSGNVILTLDGSEAGLTAQQSDALASGSFSDVASTPGPNTLTIDAANVDPDANGADFYRVRN